MTTNIGFEDGHPYIEEGANDGEFSLVGGRVTVVQEGVRAVNFTVERSVDGGETWELVLAETISGNGASLVDWESLSYGDTLYRAVAFTVEGATAETIITVEARSDAMWLSGGDGYGVAARLPFNPDKKITVSRERALKMYAGRSVPVAVVGEMTSRAVAVSGVTNDLGEDTAPAVRLADLERMPNRLFLFRDPDGSRIYGMVPTIDLSWQKADLHDAGHKSWWGYSFTLTEAT